MKPHHFTILFLLAASLTGCGAFDWVKEKSYQIGEAMPTFGGDENRCEEGFCFDRSQARAPMEQSRTPPPDAFQPPPPPVQGQQAFGVPGQIPPPQYQQPQQPPAIGFPPPGAPPPGFRPPPLAPGQIPPPPPGYQPSQGGAEPTFRSNPVNQLGEPLAPPQGQYPADQRLLPHEQNPDWKQNVPETPHNNLMRELEW